MQVSWLVFKHEFFTTLGRRSFQVAAFGLPLIALVCFGGLHLYHKILPQDLSGENDLPIKDGPAASSSKAEGYVDLSGLIQVIPESMHETDLIGFPDEAAANYALQSGNIHRYYIIPADYLSTGNIYIIRDEAIPISVNLRAPSMQSLLRVNLLGGNERLASQLDSPFTLVASGSESPSRTNSQYLTAFFLPFGVTLLFYVTILMSASLFLGTLTVEKENRILEILLTSITPRQLFTGKILGLGLAGLIQTFFWLGTSILILRWSGRSLQIPSEAHLTLSFFALGMLFFILGYGLYACLMASLGAFVSNLREASQTSILLLMPMMIPVLTISLLISAPNSPFVAGLSLFPLTSPVTMMARLVIADVPAWQVITSVLLLILAILVTIKIVASLFHTQILLSGHTIYARRILNFFSARK